MMGIRRKSIYKIDLVNPLKSVKSPPLYKTYLPDHFLSSLTLILAHKIGIFRRQSAIRASYRLDDFVVGLDFGHGVLQGLYNLQRFFDSTTGLRRHMQPFIKVQGCA